MTPSGEAKHGTPSGEQKTGQASGERMRGTEFDLLQHALFMSVGDVARHFEVKPRSVEAWSRPDKIIPPGVADDMRALDDLADELAADMASQAVVRFNQWTLAAGGDIPRPALLVYRSDEEFWQYGGSQPTPYRIGWAAAARARGRLRRDHGLRVEVVTFEPDAFADWLDARGMAHATADTVAQWAAVASGE